MLYERLSLEAGAGGSIVIQALRYKPEGRGFENDEVDDFYQLT
jgi:hypothetical protein